MVMVQQQLRKLISWRFKPYLLLAHAIDSHDNLALYRPNKQVFVRLSLSQNFSTDFKYLHTVLALSKPTSLPT